MLLDSAYWPVRDYVTAIYPQARMELVSLADETPLYFRVEIPQAQAAELQGLTQHIAYSDGRTEKRAVSKIEINDPQIKEATWEGAIRLEHGGQYELRGEDGLQVFLDDQTFEGQHYLGRGLYRLRLTWQSGSGNHPQLIWKVGDGAPQPVSLEALFRVTGPQQGLLGTYWPNMNWEGVPLFHQVTPFLLLAWPDEQPILPNGEFSARYTGLLHVTEPGDYRFHVSADDGARLILDGNILAEGLTPGQPNEFEINVELPTGDHPIQIDYFQQGGGNGLRLLWSHDGAPLTPVPPTALIPAQP
jgi:PA14 domain-containing protein